MKALPGLVGLVAIFIALASPTSADPTVGDFSTFVQVSSRRVSRVVTEFEYRVPLTADLQDLTGASVTVTSTSPFTSIVDGSLSFGVISAGATGFSLDTFSFRHDRSVPFDPLVLQYTLDPLPANRMPVADAGPDQTAFVTDRVTLDGSASMDPDGDLLSFAWSFVSLPAGSMAFLSDPGAVLPTFDLDVPGTYVIELVVNDGAAFSTPDTVVVDTANSPPVADAGPDQTVLVNESVVLDGSGSTDVDGDLLSFAWSFSIRPAGSSAVLENPTDVTPGFDVDLPGTYVVQLIVNDGTVASAPDTIVIDTGNSAPVADAGPDQTVFVTDTVILDGSGSSDADTDLLSYHWSFSAMPAGSAASLSDPAATAPTFVVDLPGTYVLQLVVDDGSLASSPDSVGIVTGNSPPIADPGPDQTVVLFDTVILDGSGSDDVDSDPLAFHWSFTSIPPGSASVLDDPAAVMPSFVADTPGNYVVQLIVNDGTSNSAPETVTITATNVAPVADAGPDQADVPIGSLVALDGSGSSDEDGHALTYSWSLVERPTGSSSELTGAASVAPEFTPDALGDYVAQLIVNDGFVDSAPDTVTISVANAPPVADAGPHQTVATGATVALDGSASSDPEGIPLQFSWALTSRPAGSAAELSDETSAHPTFVADFSGLYVLELVVNDGVQPSIPDVVAVTAEVPIVSVDATDAAAAEPGADPGTFTITRTGALAAPLAVDFTIAGSATNGTDYAPVGTSVAFASGQASTTVSVQPIDDPLVEGDETVVLTLLDGTAYDLGAPGAATVTIADNPAPVVTIAATDASASEAGDPGAFTVSRTGSLAFPLVVSYTVDGTATNGVDYALLPATVTIQDGAASVEIVVAPIDDSDFESVEGVFLQLSAGTDYLVGAPGAATVSIADDDARVFASATDFVATENSADTGTWTISRLGPTTEPLAVSYTLSGTADAGVDYEALPGSVTIPSGAAEATVTLEPIDDALFEGPETAVITLVAGPGYSVGVPGAATVTIQDDERPAVSVVATDPDANEAGLNPGVFTVSRTGPTDAALTVLFTATGSATQGVDYQSLATSVTIPSGSATATVTVNPIDDSLVEGAEHVVVVLGADPAYVVVTPGIASVTIADDDHSVVTVEATDPDAHEAGPTPGTFTFRRTGDTSAALIVFASRGGTATNGSDYTGLGGSSFAVSIPAGETSTTVTLSPLADNLVEDSETVVLTISPNLNYVVGSPSGATVTIADDPAVLTLMVSDPAAAEAGRDPGAFVITRSGGNLGATLNARFSLTGTASNNSDYGLISGSKEIPAGQTAVAVEVLPLLDNSVEGDETVVLTLVAPQTVVTYLVGSPSSGTVTIADDPPVVTATATDPDAAEAGPDPGTITFTRSGGNLGANLAVFFTKSGTATNGADYHSLGGSLSLIAIPANQHSVEVTILPLTDNLVESPESAILTLAPSAGYAIGASASAAVTIADDPPVVTVSATDPDAAETGPDPGTFTFTRSGGNLAASLSVTFARSGTATNFSDYANIGFSLSIPAGQAAATVTIAPVDDSLVEGPETVILTINPGTSYIVGASGSATVTIADND